MKRLRTCLVCSFLVNKALILKREIGTYQDAYRSISRSKPAYILIGNFTFCAGLNIVLIEGERVLKLLIFPKHDFSLVENCASIGNR